VDRLACRVEDPDQLRAGEGAVHGDLAREEVAGVEAPHVLQPQEATIVDVAHHEPDLVHVRRHHQAAGAGGGALDRVEVAERVGLEIVHVVAHVVLDVGAHTLLAAGNAGEFRESLEMIHAGESTARACVAGARAQW
jgi:hypothetical protein